MFLRYFRKHFSSIVFLGLLIVVGAVSGVFWLVFAAFMHLPTWFVFVACCTGGIAGAVLADPVERALTGWYEERQRRQEFLGNFPTNEGDDQ